MEGSEENSIPKPDSEDEPNHHQSELQQELGLGFQSSPNLNPHPPTPDDLDQQTTTTTTATEELQPPINEELQTQQTHIEEELKNLALEEKEKLSDLNREEEGVEGSENETHEEGTDGEVGIDDERSENEKEEEESGIVSGLRDGRFRNYNYPVRPDAEDCSYYMRNGICKFGSNCKFNHPIRRKNQAAKEKVKEKEDNSERPGQTECKYYLRPGGCKYGKACRYNHSRVKTSAAPVVEFNFLGLPIRLGEKECPFYMRNGSCKYGSNCRFNHPDPSVVRGGDSPSQYGNGGSVSLEGAAQSNVSSWLSPMALNEAGPFVPVMFSPTHGVASPNLEWNGYQAPVYPAPERILPVHPAFALSNPVETNTYTHHKQQMLVDEFPERPGQPECSYFLKTGDCKYRSGCKFHHPRNRIPKTASCVLSDKGLPLRPDQIICSHYNRYGICKFGPACKFDHPVNYGHSDSSTVSGPEMPSSTFGTSATADGARLGGGENRNEDLVQPV